MQQIGYLPVGGRRIRHNHHDLLIVTIGIHDSLYDIRYHHHLHIVIRQYFQADIGIGRMLSV